MGYKNSLSTRSSSVLYSKWYCIVKKGTARGVYHSLHVPLFHGSLVLYNVVLHCIRFDVCIIIIDFGERFIV